MLKVGLIGASPTRGWARVSHVPALQAVPGLALAAVVGSDQAKADLAAQAYGAPVGYGHAAALFADASIDIVTVAVRVPDHLHLVLSAIEAGKHVYCEWPLGRTVEEARAMADAARKRGVKVAVGLQARRDPAAVAAAGLVAGGSIGRVLGARVFSSTMGWGPTTEAALAFAEDPASAVNLVTIQAMHTIDLAIAVVGELAELDAMAGRQFPEVRIDGVAEPRKREIFDHLLVQARLATGGMLAIEVVGGRPAGDIPFRFEVVGDRGTLTLAGGAPRGFQSGRLGLSIDGEPQPIAPGVPDGLPDEAVSVAALYADLRDDILEGTRTAPDFEHAVGLTRLIDDVLASSREGRRVRANGWPSS